MGALPRWTSFRQVKKKLRLVFIGRPESAVFEQQAGGFEHPERLAHLVQVLVFQGDVDGHFVDALVVVHELKYFLAKPGLHFFQQVFFGGIADFILRRVGLA